MSLVLRVGFVLAVTVLAYWSWTAAVLCVCASILAALQSKAGVLVELSFGPLKAKLERDVSKAEELVEKLRHLAILQAKATIGVSVRTGRWADNGEWIYDSVLALERSLRDIGVSDDGLKEARAEFIRYTAFDLGGKALGAPYVPTEAGQEAINEWKTIEGLDRTPEQIESFLQKWGMMNPQREQYLADMREIRTTGVIRDRAQYLRSSHKGV